MAKKPPSKPKNDTGNDSSKKPKDTKGTTSSTEVKPADTKTTNALKKQAVDSVKKTTPITPKRANADLLINTVINQISGAVRGVKEIDDRSFANVTDIVETALKELESEGKLNRQSGQAIKVRRYLHTVTLFLEDQIQAIELLKKKF